MKLTDEQIKLATNIMIYEILRSSIRSISLPLETEPWRIAFDKAAPFLQLPWGMPTLDEIQIGHKNSLHHFDFLEETHTNTITYSAGMPSALARFVYERNQLLMLMPKPVDPRREKISRILNGHFQPTEAIVDSIIAALDAKE